MGYRPEANRASTVSGAAAGVGQWPAATHALIRSTKRARKKPCHQSSSTCGWQPTDQALPLASYEVHVYRATLDLPASQVHRLTLTLSPDERERAERLRFAKHRQRFVVARGLLRIILGQMLGLRAEQVCFRYTPHGKPELDGETGADSLRFNLSHSHGLAVYALAHDGRVGIDLERVRSDVDTASIAASFFSSSEIAVLRALAPDLQTAAFFRAWTLKEAYLKARGEGLALPLDRLDVSPFLGKPAALASVEHAPQEAACWSLQTLSPGPGYAAALAVEGTGWQLRCAHWTP